MGAGGLGTYIFSFQRFDEMKCLFNNAIEMLPMRNVTTGREHYFIFVEGGWRVIYDRVFTSNGIIINISLASLGRSKLVGSISIFTHLLERNQNMDKSPRNCIEKCFKTRVKVQSRYLIFVDDTHHIK